MPKRTHTGAPKQGPLTKAETKDYDKGKPAHWWVMTINNPTDQEKTLCIEHAKVNCTRAVVALEKGKSGTPHLQIRMLFKVAKRFAALKKTFPRAWIAVAKVECFSYEMKLGSQKLLVWDTRAPDQQSSLDDFHDAIVAGATRTELAKKHPGYYRRYRNMVPHIRDIYKEQEKCAFDTESFIEPLDFTKSKSIVLWGPPGVGKTQYALSHFKKPLWVHHNDDLKLLDSDCDGLIFDSRDFKHLYRSACVHLVDWEHETTVHCRYTTARIPKNMRRIFTTTIRDGAIFGKHSDDPGLQRRVNFVEIRCALKTPTQEMKDAMIKYYGQ